VIRVAITTDRFEGAASYFRPLGLGPVRVPCIRVEPAGADLLDRAREAALAADLLLITSVRTLDLLWPEGSMPAVEVAAVGERTAAAVQARGGRVVLTGQAGLAELALQTAERLASVRIAFPHAAGSDPVALGAIRAQAIEVQDFEVYRTIPVAPGSTRVEAVAFGSPSAVEGWLLSRDFDGLVIGVIGPTTWEAVARHRPPEVVAAQPSYQALAHSLATYLEVAV
jgi:uroporphyrinogen-III synthase